MIAFDPEKMRTLATDTRNHAGAIGKLSPIGEHNRDAAPGAMPFSAFAKDIQLVLQAMDRAVTLHQGRLDQFATLTDNAAGTVDGMEEANVAGFKGIK
ncbi:hypothetical protein AB0I30_07245 [Nocardia tengchongensis]|uniref:hypothetical protein n=1 Tax=Nocardia tengchongensis TaxID=2055889 RepID=UPI0033C73A15